MIKSYSLNPEYSTTRKVYRLKNKKKAKLNVAKKKLEGGLRVKNYFKQSSNNNSLITIITVTYNCKNLIRRTIKSVLDLSYDNIEFIIIDGGSTDGTLEIIKKNNELIDYWVSEKDNGIYEAMNKGSRLSKGEAVFFLNAGDKLINKQFVKLIKLFEKNYFLYGNNFVLCGTHTYTNSYPGFKYLKDNFIPFLGRLPSHQSMIIPRKLQLKNKYDQRFPISADKDFKIKIYLKKIRFIFINHVVCLSLPGGKSQYMENHLHLKNRTLETFYIFKKNYNFFWALIYSLCFYSWNLRKIINKKNYK